MGKRLKIKQRTYRLSAKRVNLLAFTVILAGINGSLLVLQGDLFGNNMTVSAGKICGEGNDSVQTSIDIGCMGKGNPITDVTFAIIRFLSIGVGLVIIGSIVVAGIQFTSSRGDPQATAQAITRIRNTVAALVLYLFIFAFLNWVVPAGIF